jgi:hypothetical protein
VEFGFVFPELAQTSEFSFSQREELEVWRDQGRSAETSRVDIGQSSRRVSRRTCFDLDQRPLRSAE